MDEMNVQRYKAGDSVRICDTKYNRAFFATDSEYTCGHMTIGKTYVVVGIVDKVVYFLDDCCQRQGLHCSYLCRVDEHSEELLVDKIKRVVREEVNCLLSKGKDPIKIGDRFVCKESHCKNEYILAAIGSEGVLLINLRSGARWDEPVVVRDMHNISNEEFRCIANDHSAMFVKLNKEIENENR